MTQVKIPESLIVNAWERSGRIGDQLIQAELG